MKTVDIRCQLTGCSRLESLKSIKRWCEREGENVSPSMRWTAYLTHSFITPVQLVVGSCCLFILVYALVRGFFHCYWVLFFFFPLFLSHLLLMALDCVSPIYVRVVYFMLFSFARFHCPFYLTALQSSDWCFAAELAFFQLLYWLWRYISLNHGNRAWH